jgi:hypothetical protein
VAVRLRRSRGQQPARCRRGGWCYLIDRGNKPRGPEAGLCDIGIIMLLLVLHSSGYSGGAVIVGTVQRDVDAAKDPVLAEVALADFFIEGIGFRSLSMVKRFGGQQQ